MSNDAAFLDKVKELKKEVAGLPDDVSAEKIEETAARLEGLNYAPPVIIENGKFLWLTKDGLLGEIDRILAMPDQEACALAPNEPLKCQDLRIQFISVQIYYFKILVQLRMGDLEAWDEVDEMYVHD